MQIDLRDATPADASELLKIYSYYVANTAASFEYEVPSEAEFKRRIERTLENYPYLVATTVDGKIVGYAYASAFVGRAAYRFSTELTVYVAKDCRGRGVGSELYRALEDDLRARGVKNLYACVAFAKVEDEYLTAARVKFHERQGFKICGKFTDCGFKFERWYSMIWMEKILEAR